MVYISMLSLILSVRFKLSKVLFEDRNIIQLQTKARPDEDIFTTDWLRLWGSLLRTSSFRLFGTPCSSDRDWAREFLPDCVRDAK
jgi:hypothetical protein